MRMKIRSFLPHTLKNGHLERWSFFFVPKNLTQGLCYGIIVMSDGGSQTGAGAEDARVQRL